MIVLKFGGTSVQDADAICRLVKIVSTRPGKRWVVVSALSKVTDALVQIGDLASLSKTAEAVGLCGNLESRHLQLCEELGLQERAPHFIRDQFSKLKLTLQSLDAIGELTARSKDRILAVGELCSSVIVAEAFRVHAIKVSWVDSREFLRTDATFGGAQVDFEETGKICKSKGEALFRESDVVVSGGYIGGTLIREQVVTTTLGRGGSDYSAAVFGAAMCAEKVEIWTDVDGILTTDPRVVPEAKRILKLSYDEAAELAYFGAKVLHPATIHPAVKNQIPVWVLNSKNPDCTGTEITLDSLLDDSVVKAIACKRNVTLVNINSTRMLGAAGFLQSVFEAFAREKVSIDLISTSEVNVSLTLDPQSDSAALQRVIAELSRFSVVTVEEKMASVATVGRGMRKASGVAARIFGALKEFSVSMISMGSSEINLGFVVKDSVANDVIKRLHAEFFSGDLNPALFAQRN